ncbi:Crp/Fnr family transcriptional regulator [Bradyrhizobium australiense]|uniref:Crp/Fnr family transcriptional regulator n=1 Tax=Bradyrhizobium australiense TaxID=2721161 RepID=A0A7Y4LXV6_9BRAD|nr:Crp/Fnr family transcriptional regulator [Bradyrhizobium australiense]NOJ42917.1 Crp/Fnr family transcriptional regulator [Bradyrhizobium australiense]
MQSFSSNLLLSSFDPPDLEVLRPHLRPVALESTKILHEAGEKISGVYFPFDAVVSLVVLLESGETVEAAMVGRDGVVGASAALDGKLALNRAIVQIGGHGVLCEPDTFKRVMLDRPGMLSTVISHEQTVYAQAQQSAACNILHDSTARLCRWLLRARDLSGSDTLPFTQEFLAEMLGVRRTTVSPVAHMLQAAGMIRYRRGKIEITDVEALRESACECYETVRDNYDRLLGRKRNSGSDHAPQKD